MKKTFHYILILCAVLFFFSCDKKAKRSESEQIALTLKIVDWQDRKNVDSLIAQLKDFDADIQAKAALALGNIRDTLSKKELINLLSNENENLRASVALSMGFIGHPDFFAPLKTQLEKEKNPETALYFFEAIGRIVNPESIAFFEKISTENPAYHKGIALGLFRLMSRKILVDKAHAILQKTKDVETKQILSMYLTRAQVRESAGDIEKILSMLSSEKDAITKANLTVLLQAFPGHEAILIQLYEKESDSRIRVNAVRAMSYKNFELVKPILFAVIEDKNPHVQSMAAEVLALKKLAPSELEKIAEKASARQAKVHLWKAIVQADSTLAFSKKLQKILENSPDLILKAMYVETLGGQIGNAAYIQQILMKDTGFVRTNAAYALAAMHNSPAFMQTNDENKKRLAEMVKYAISTADDALCAVAAGQLLTNPNFGYKQYFKDAAFLKETISKLTLPQNIETYQILQNAVAYFEDTEAQKITSPFNNPIDFDQLRKLGKNPILVFITEKGVIKANLYPDVAPGTVAYLTKLAQNGFYNGKTFHRVIPNFVAQGGCPRGDGWGGTALSLRTEVGKARFEVGALGMAAAGMDTESCQFFFTLMPTPHLDGNYTVFGKLKEGFDVLEKIEVGDKIINCLVEI